MKFTENEKFERICDLPDNEAYAELVKLPPSEQAAFKAYMEQKAEYYKKLCQKEELKIQEMEEEIKQQEEEYNRLKGLH